jgi:CDP-diacylglycerol--serine O-phosphatidyltransferase
MNEAQYQQSHQTKMLTFARDLSKICSLAGLFCAVLCIYYAILGNFPAAIIGMIWAVFFDWADGIIACRMKDRTDEYRAFGGQLDSLIDIVSFGICPAVLLFELWKIQSLVSARSVRDCRHGRNTAELFQCFRPCG